MLDAERCILCSRCVRFCDEITGTGELGIFSRGDHSGSVSFPGRTSRTTIRARGRICPVGALTDATSASGAASGTWTREVRSVPVARADHVEVHVNRKRPHHAAGGAWPG